MFSFLFFFLFIYILLLNFQSSGTFESHIELSLVLDDPVGFDSAIEFLFNHLQFCQVDISTTLSMAGQLIGQSSDVHCRCRAELRCSLSLQGRVKMFIVDAGQS